MARTTTYGPTAREIIDWLDGEERAGNLTLLVVETSVYMLPPVPGRGGVPGVGRRGVMKAEAEINPVAGRALKIPSWA